MKLSLSGCILLGCALLGGSLLRAETESQRESICLNGVWQGMAVPTRDAVIPQGEWSPVRVPSSWGEYEARNFPMPSGFGASTLAVWYARSLPVPAAWCDGRRIFLKFMAIHEAHSIWVNGRQVWSAPGGRYCTAVDITDALHSGENNELKIQTILPTHKIDFNRYIRDLGITRDIFLTAEPPAAVAYALVRPSVKNHELCIKYGLTNREKQAVTLPLKAVVLDEQGKTALTLPERTVTLAPGESREVEVKAPWTDAVLWGFGPYGQPYLYKLKTDFGRDERFDRFGFREFTTQGTDFYLNGKRIFLKGDLVHRYTVFYENPANIAVFFRRLAANGMNFLRLHGFRFDSHCWYEMADEMGFLVEAQAREYRDAEGDHAPDSDRVKEMWRSYVLENYNHPSIVFWSIDNETFQPGKVKPDLLRHYDALSTFVREFDPTRIVELNHNYAVYPFIARGVFRKENFQTFNIHPYGSLTRRINGETRATGFQFEVPVVVGEVFAFPSRRDFVNQSGGTAAEQWRVGDSFATQIEEASRARGVGSILLCSLDDTGFVGYNREHQLELGPWSNHALLDDDHGKLTGQRRFKVAVPWPSLSGAGVRPEYILGYNYDGGACGFNMNWFDPTAPFFRSNTVADRVRNAFAAIPDGPVPELGERRPEVLVLLPQEAAGAVVRVRSQGDGETRSVASDPAGRAWFRLDNAGSYTAEYHWKGQDFKRDFRIDARPRFADRPGYDYLTYVEFAPGLTAAVKDELAKPVRFVDLDVLRAGEILANGDFEDWITADRCENWNAPGLENVPGAEGGQAIRLTGARPSATQNIRLQKGTRYRVSGMIRKDSGGRHGCLTLRSRDWKIKLQLNGSDEPGVWETVSADYVADGSEIYFYCSNDYMGDRGSCTFDRVSVKKLEDAVAAPPPPVQPGPFAVADNGFLRHWLVLGPLPNVKVNNHFTGMDFDPNALEPKPGRAVEVVFPDGCYWKPGKQVLKWAPLHTEADYVDLTGQKLPEIGISAAEPAYVAACLYAEVISPERRQAKLAVGSDDGYQLWFNGRKLGELMEYRAAQADQECYEVTLEKGKNKLMVKVLQHIGGWGAMVRFLDLQGTPLTDLQIVLPQEN